jgi:hypothetical protein
MIIWNILWPFGIIYGRLYSLWEFVIFFPIWKILTKKNLATLMLSLDAIYNKKEFDIFTVGNLAILMWRQGDQIGRIFFRLLCDSLLWVVLSKLQK